MPIPKNLSPINISMQLDASRLFVSLTDGRAAIRQGSTSHDPKVMERIVAGLDSERDAAQALFGYGFPGTVGEFLRRSPLRELRLQLTPDLDPWPWERASDGSEALGIKFHVARQLVHDDDLWTPALPEAPRADGLRVIRLGPHGPSGRSVGVSSMHVRNAGLEVPSADALRSLIDGQDVVFIEGPPRVLELLPANPATWQHVPGLFVACVDGKSPPSEVARAVCRLGSALMVGPCDVLHDDELEMLCRHLTSGYTVGDAVRRLRKAPRCSDLRLYGEAARVLSQVAGRLAVQDDLRQVTVLSFDLVESTRLLRRLGDERYSELLATFHARCADVVRRHGGVSDDPQGDDGIMCYFGFPVAHEAAAQRAVRAGLDIVATVAGLDVQVRVGIATGRVAIKSGQPIGVAIHLAARLQSMARPGTVLVSETTGSLVRNRFELEPVSVAGELKGIDAEPPPHRVVSDLRSAADGIGWRPGLTPFVGRESELGLLKDAWEAARQGHTRFVLITGEAGIGKSRLVREFRRSLRGRSDDALECRCLPDARNSSFIVLGDTLRRVLKFQEQDDIDTRLDKIERGLPSGVSAADAVPLVAALLAVPYQSRYPEPRASADRIRHRTLATLLQWFRFAARAAPLCLIVEDVQWIDPSTREFLGRLTADAVELPLLVIVTLRTDDESSWRMEQPFVSINLLGLPADVSRLLVRHASGGAVLPTSIIRMLAARADGVPLFLEESARMAAQLSARDYDQLLRLKVPTSLQDLLMARVDSLGPAKPVAQLGAVLGREFPAALLEAVLRHESSPVTFADATTQLLALERSGLLLRSGDASEPRYLFKHALVRETAYESLWGRDRQRVHRTVALVLRERFAALAERQPELLAHHYTEAGLDGEALRYWELAARRAASRSAHDEAISHLTRALALLDQRPPDRERDSIELRLQLLLASRYIATEGYGADRVERVYARAAELCKERDDRTALIKVELGLEGYHFMRADFARAMEITRAAATLAETLDDPTHRVQATWAEAIILWHQGDQTPRALTLMDQCLTDWAALPYHPGAVQDPGVMSLCYSAWGRWEMGYPDEALRRIDRALAIATQRDHKFSLGEAHGFAANVHHFRGDIATALASVTTAIQICEEGGFAVWLAHALVTQGRLLCEIGRHDDGLAKMREGYAMWVDTGAVVTRPLYLTMQAEGLALACQYDESLARLDEALSVIARHGERYHAAEVYRLKGSVLLQLAAAEGRDVSAEAEGWLCDALRLAGKQQKRSFALRSAMALARMWSARGVPDRAVAMLAPELGEFREGLETRDVRAARALLVDLRAQRERR